MKKTGIQISEGLARAVVEELHLRVKSLDSTAYNEAVAGRHGNAEEALKTRGLTCVILSQFIQETKIGQLTVEEAKIITARAAGKFSAKVNDNGYN